MRMISFLRNLLSERHMSPAIPSPAPTQLKQELRAALLKCASLTEAEVDAYIAYEFEGIVYEVVPLDYDLKHPGEETSCLYADGILQTKILRRHTHQIAPEILVKVQQVLPELFCPPHPWSNKS